MKKLMLVLICLLGWGLKSGIAQSENIFDTTASLQYAQHLYKSKEYRLAQEEFQRLHFLLPKDTTVLEYLLKTQRLNGAVQDALAEFQTSYQNSVAAPAALQKEYYLLLLEQEDFEKALRLNAESTAFTQHKDQRRLALLLRQGKIAQVLAASDSLATESAALTSLILRGQDLPRKSPVLAGIMSGLVPGTGRMYAGRWQDGLISLATVGGSIFGAIRGFQARGVESAYGWIFGAIGATFYVSNIYGSVRSAQLYNQTQIESYHQDVESYLYHLD